ncbi:MAG: isoaspartyl peptidase/L-asparaginase family protein [Candidatus Thorarchaeota archaeon]|jgi:beta-aspartyl-peptidase (threonine type)
MRLPAIIVHGGAGNWKDERIPIGLEEVENAAITGFETLRKGGSCLDAAEASTSYMESCGRLNAGLGARPNSEGDKELDAIIVDGFELNTGAVMAVKGIQNPTALARYIMERTEYVMFAGDGAHRLYEKMISDGYRLEAKPGVVQPPLLDKDGDTVGCIAVDVNGHIAATSSTGGISEKMPGRVGDSSIFGAGAYANKVCGATATGYGEHIVRVVMCRMAVQYFENGANLQRAADMAMELLERETGSEAGLVMADREGNIGKSTNAKAMPTVVIRQDIGNIERFKR